MKKCQPGMICIENVTLFFLMFIIGLIIYFMYVKTDNYRPPPPAQSTTNYILQPETHTAVRDVLINPHVPPLSIDRPTSSYSQVGIMTPVNGDKRDNILPLMGRILYNRRDLWNYYTISNQHNNIKLPISVKGKSGLSENGIDKIYNGDTVFVEGVNAAYKVTIYENDNMRYLPMI
jgi:hypothetical protein